jgi:hypothetical protein
MRPDGKHIEGGDTGGRVNTPWPLRYGNCPSVQPPAETEAALMKEMGGKRKGQRQGKQRTEKGLSRGPHAEERGTRVSKYEQTANR